VRTKAAVVAFRDSGLITGSRGWATFALKATSAGSRYREFMESILRRSQAICPPAQSGIRIDSHSRDFGFGLSTHFVQRAKSSYLQDLAMSGNALVKIAHLPGPRKLQPRKILNSRRPPALGVCSKRDSFAPRKELCLTMAVFKMKKCPTCIACEGTGEIPTDQ
jgi:hypothetical protein